MWIKRTATVLLALALTGLLGACGGGGGSDGAAPVSLDAAAADGNEADDDADRPSQEEVQDAALEYAQCMREHGVDMPDPEVKEGGELAIRMSPGDASPDELDAAEAECRPILDEVRGEGPQLDPDEIAKRQDQALALAECMRERGHDFPDPEVSEGGGIAIRAPEGGRPGDPGFEEFQADMEACHEEAGMPTPEEGGRGGTFSEEVEG